MLMSSPLLVVLLKWGLRLRVNRPFHLPRPLMKNISMLPKRTIKEKKNWSNALKCRLTRHRHILIRQHLFKSSFQTYWGLFQSIVLLEWNTMLRNKNWKKSEPCVSTDASSAGPTWKIWLTKPHSLCLLQPRNQHPRLSDSSSAVPMDSVI